jgi:hypothetical protein
MGIDDEGRGVLFSESETSRFARAVSPARPVAAGRFLLSSMLHRPFVGDGVRLRRFNLARSLSNDKAHGIRWAALQMGSEAFDEFSLIRSQSHLKQKVSHSHLQTNSGESAVANSPLSCARYSVVRGIIPKVPKTPMTPIG